MGNVFSSLLNYSSREPDSFIRIFIRTISGKNVPISIPQDSTVKDLKAWIRFEKFDLAQVNDFHLIFDGKNLHDARYLAYYSLKENSVI